MKLALAGQSYTSRSVTAAAQSCINLYPERIEDPNEAAQGKSRAALYGIPGRHLFKDLTTIHPSATPGRGLWSGGGRMFVAAGTKYFEISEAGALIGLVHTIADDATHTPVQFFPNGNQLFIVSADRAYIDNGSGPTLISFAALSGTVNTNGTTVTWVSGNTFDVGMTGQQITINGINYTVNVVLSSIVLTLTATAGVQSAVTYSSTPILTARTGAFLDLYFIVNRPFSRQFNISAINDGSTWDALDLALKEGYPDHIRSVLADNEQLYVFGEEIFEVFQNTGNADFPFERINGASGRFGSISPWGPIAIDGHVYFIGGNSKGQISAYVLAGFVPKRISTHAIEAQWNAASLGENCVSYSYLEEGHSFWVINFGTQTWAFDTTTGAWHERYKWNGSAFTDYPTRYHAFIPEWGTGGKHITAGSGDGKLYESSVNFYDDDGADTKWQRALPHLYNQRSRMYFGRLELEMETGTIPSGSEPVVSRDYSDDRGHTFANAVTAGIGTNAQYTKRVFWPSNGSSYDRVYRLSGTGQHKVALIDAEIAIEAGDN